MRTDCGGLLRDRHLSWPRSGRLCSATAFADEYPSVHPPTSTDHALNRVVSAGTSQLERARLHLPRASSHHPRHTHRRHQVVVLLDDLTVLAVVRAELFEPLAAVGEHLEVSGLHLLQDLLNARLSAVATCRMRRVLSKHLHAFAAVLACKLIAGALVMRVAIVGPRYRVRTPGLDRGGMDRNHRLCLPVGVYDVVGPCGRGRSPCGRRQSGGPNRSRSR